MKGFVIALLLTIAIWPGVATSALGALQPSPATAADGDSTSGGDMTETQMAQAIAQGGAIGILAVVLFFYRRDFLGLSERRKEDAQRLEELLERSNQCITDSAVATARQTDATHRLARTVETMERRQAGLPPAPSA